MAMFTMFYNVHNEQEIQNRENKVEITKIIMTTENVNEKSIINT